MKTISISEATNMSDTLLAMSRNGLAPNAKIVASELHKDLSDIITTAGATENVSIPHELLTRSSNFITAHKH